MNSKCGLPRCQLRWRRNNSGNFLLAMRTKVEILAARPCGNCFIHPDARFLMSANEPAKAGGFSSESPACGVLVIDSRERIMVCTPEAAALLHLDAAKLLDAPLDSLPSPLAKIIRYTTTSGKSAANQEIFADNVTALRVNTFPVKSEILVVLNHFSIGANHQNMRRLDQLASLGSLSAGMAHEIKNGMVAVKTFVELLLEKNQDAELNEVVGRELKRIDGIVTQMLRLAAPRHAVFTTVNIHPLLDHSLRLVQHQISGKLISLRCDYNAETDAVRGNEAHLQQAFMNLLFNAIEAMGANGTLTINTETGNGENGARILKIKIHDTGVGI